MSNNILKKKKVFFLISNFYYENNILKKFSCKNTFGNAESQINTFWDKLI